MASIIGEISNDIVPALGAAGVEYIVDNYLAQSVLQALGLTDPTQPTYTVAKLVIDALAIWVGLLLGQQVKRALNL